MLAIMLGADNGFFYAGQVMHFSGPFTVFLIYHKQSILSYTHFTLEERKYLQQLLSEGLSFR